MNLKPYLRENWYQIQEKIIVRLHFETLQDLKYKVALIKKKSKREQNKIPCLDKVSDRQGLTMSKTRFGSRSKCPINDCKLYKVNGSRKPKTTPVVRN